jgi:hypothetical protein
MGTKMADYGVAGLENPDFPHCEKVLYIIFQNIPFNLRHDYFLIKCIFN